MKYLGIDYGTKKIGIALSDESGLCAFPHKIIPQNTLTLHEVLDIIARESVEMIIVGHSMNLAGTHNDVMVPINHFIEKLRTGTSLPVTLQDERFSSSAVRAFDWKKPIASPQRTSRDSAAIDDRAAAIILQRYLDKQK